MGSMLAFIGTRKHWDSIIEAHVKIAGSVERLTSLRVVHESYNVYIGVTLYKMEFFKGLRSRCPS